MDDQGKLVGVFLDWLVRLKQATSEGNGAEICEATRMVLAIGAIIHAFRRGAWRMEMAAEATNAFDQALQAITNELKMGENPDGNYEIYQRNIADRLDNLTRAMPDWCPEYVDATKADSSGG